MKHEQVYLFNEDEAMIESQDVVRVIPHASNWLRFGDFHLSASFFLWLCMMH